MLDRNGKVLAASEDAADVIATPYQVEDPARTALKLHDILDVPAPDLADALSDRSSGFAYLARKVDPTRGRQGRGPAHRRDLDRAQQPPPLPAGRPRLAGDRRGRHRQPGPDRARALRERRPRRANGEQDVVHDAVGRPLRLETVSPASIGDDIQTTIDAAIQDKTEQALAEAAEHYGAKGATAIVMNPNTGDVLAMANWPGFDPSDLADASDRTSSRTAPPASPTSRARPSRRSRSPRPSRTTS